MIKAKDSGKHLFPPYKIKHAESSIKYQASRNQTSRIQNPAKTSHPFEIQEYRTRSPFL